MPLFVDPRIKTLYSEKVFENLLAGHVWSEGYNTNYEGQISGRGQALRILSFPIPETRSYDVPDGPLTGMVGQYDRMSPVFQELVIDRDSEWRLAEDRLQAFLASPDAFSELINNATWKFLDDSDRDLAIGFAEGAGVIDPLGSPVTVGFDSGESTAVIVMGRLCEELAIRRAPRRDLHIFVPEWFYTMLWADARLIGFGTAETATTLRGERIMKIAGITIHETINSLNGAGNGFSTEPDGSNQNRIIAVYRPQGGTWGRHWDTKDALQTFDSSENVLSWDRLARARYVWGRKITNPGMVISQLVARGAYEPA